MFRNYLIVAIRNLIRHKGFSLINILGLSIGTVFCILTFLFIRNEWTYDSFHENADRIYRVSYILKSEGYITSITPAPMAETIEREIPGIECTVRLTSGEFYRGLVNFKDNSFTETLSYADPSFFKMFSFPLLKGNPLTALNEKYSVVISSKMAKKYFSDENPMGKTVSLRLAMSNIDFQDFVVTGVARNMPENSSIKFDFLLNYKNYEDVDKNIDDWGRGQVETYIRIHDNVGKGDLEKNIFTIYKINYQNRYKDRDFDRNISLQPVTDIHFSKERWERNNSPAKSFILSGISLLVLLIACINYINLSIGLSSNRFVEIRMRKVLGAGRRQLITQILVESTVLSMLALFFGMFLAEFLLPVFNGFVERNLTMDILTNRKTITFLFALAALLGIISGSYPALFLSSFYPLSILKNRTKFGGSNLFSKALVIFQFSLSIILIVCAITMSKQLLFLQSKDLGFDKKQVVVIDATILRLKDCRSLLEKYRNELKQYEQIINISATFDLLGKEFVETRHFSYSNEEIPISCIRIDYDYFKTLRLQLVEGRDFSMDFPSDRNRAVIVNESFVKKYGKTGWQSGFFRDREIIGVVKDFNFLSLHKKIEPLIFYPLQPFSYNILVRIKPDNISASLSILKEKYKEIVPGYPFVYYFLDDHLDSQYREEQRWRNIIMYSTMFAIFISCFGLFALTSLAAARRTKEIGIRKVLGASIYNISALISKEFTCLVILANIIACPVAWYAMNRWLLNFAYRIDLSWWIFLLAGALVLIIALSTVSFHAIKAACADPVEALRYE